MPVNVQQTGAINNIYPNSPNVFNNNQKEAVYNVIGQLTYADIFRNNAGTIVQNQTMRLDMQGTFVQGGDRFHNLQVQVNGVNGNSTVAHANVSESTMTNDPANQTGVLNKVISALNQSFDNAASYQVDGTAP
ncbi:hypothetical protein L4174_018575 [Photobacterium sp. CCB-ST2H9]|uniref:hypothetical protein n=1 Tax=Photobacterium sp. CCB-ST2H9 TaxID=2912855 RepID=UPI002005B547|nr:hypothetical protein [Photobacterium sp. CCB-ST2H9]UTM60067.1 hypothetical protein L4174_018575 [Photobacterium sp. CCB-ST2H9]